MSLVYIVRHGQSEANVDSRVYQEKLDADIQLTAYGEQQARDAGNIINEYRSANYEVGKVSTSIHTSPYNRTMHTASIISEILKVKKIYKNLLLSEITSGDQLGCDTEDFKDRPIEHRARKKAGDYFYRPIRGENLLDLHVRSGLFVTQQKFFQYCGINIIVSHASLCLMLHYFLTGECPDISTPITKALEYWPTGHIRKYIGNNNGFKYVPSISRTPPTRGGDCP